MTIRDQLLVVIPDESRVSDGESVRDLHGRDLSHHPPHAPDVVVYPTSTEEVAAVLGWANAEGVPVVPYGAGSSLEGHTLAVRGGISLDLTQMDAIEVRPQDLLAVVQAGATRETLNARAAWHGLWFPVDPGADATLGGMAATNAKGTTTVRYGSTRANVLALEVVLADGSIVRTGSRARKTSAGYDLTGLFVGSEGTLGVITEVTVALHGIPEQTVAVRATFPTFEAASRAAVSLVAGGLTVSRVELVDASTLAAVNEYKGTSYEETPTLFVELSGAPAAIAGDLELTELAFEAEGCLALATERDPEAQLLLWRARHDAGLALFAAFPGLARRGTDLCVPLSELPAAARRAEERCRQAGFPFALLAHAGDANYHLSIVFDSRDASQSAAVENLCDRLVDDALALGGTCSGEHGIGMGKIRYLEQEHGDLVPLMRGIKQLLDPSGILNPGKVLSTPAEPALPSAP